MQLILKTPKNDLTANVLHETIGVLIKNETEGFKITPGVEGQTVITEEDTGRRFLVELHEFV